MQTADRQSIQLKCVAVNNLAHQRHTTRARDNFRFARDLGTIAET